MEKLLILLFATFITLSSSGQKSKEIAFANRIVEVFKSKNFDNYKQLTPTKADFEALYNDKGVVRGLWIDTDEKYKKAVESYDRSADSAYRTDFNRLLKKGDKLSIDWTQITFLKLVFQKDKPKNSDKTFLSGFINFKYKDAVYVLFGLEAMEINGDYKISMIRTVQKGEVKKYINPDLLDNDDL